MLQSGAPAEPSSPEFAARVAAAGQSFGNAGVVGVYLVHGTFAGNDALGLLTELARFAPGLSESLRKLGKSAIDAIAGETGNYTPEFAARFEELITEGAGRPIPVRLFNWSSQNTHVGRADGAVQLLDELANFAAGLPAYTLPPAPSRPHVPPAPSPSVERAGERGSGEQDQQLKDDAPNPRLLLWAHSHGGNVFALLTHLLGGDHAARREFFHAARSFYRTWWSRRIDLPAWQRVEELLAGEDHPLRRLHLDFATFGAPVRYGWETAGYARLLHFVIHRPAPDRHPHQAAYPLEPRRMLAAADGDYVQHLGIMGSGLPANPLALRTLIANFRLRRLLHRGHPFRWVTQLLKHGDRVHDDGTTLLVDYDDPETNPLRHLFGHAVYTRSRWLPLHCEQVAEHFYGVARNMV